jgi:SEC-C motif domain protein
MTTVDGPLAPSPDERCPCLSGDVFGACCRRFVSGVAQAPTAVQLMRSRYTAFATGAAEYLLETWHPSTRPPALDLDAALRWYRLDIVRIERGGPLDAAGSVEFVARYRSDGDRGELHETSRFTRERGRWYYIDGDV